MARAKEKDKAAKNLDVMPDEPNEMPAEPETPWYQFTDWWAGLGAQAAESKIVSLFDDAHAGDPKLEWLVVPGWMIASLLVARAQREHDIAKMRSGSGPSMEDIQEAHERKALELRAWDLLLEMIRAQGKWSPRYVEEAWAGAEAFVARSKGRQPQPTNITEDGETADGH